MGNCQACLSRKSVRGSTSEEEDEAEQMIRVVRTTDNELFQFPGPVSVKDLLFGFQGFAVFPHPSSSSSLKPLPPHTLLNFRHLYYLQPSAHPSFINSNPHSIQSLIKPFIDFGTYSLLNHSDKDLLLAHQTSVNHGIQGDFITFNAQDKAFNDFSGDLLAMKKSQEMLIAGDLINPQEAGALNELAINYAQEASFSEQAEGLITIKAPQDERPADLDLPDGSSLPLNAHDRSLNELAEVINAPEEPSSFDVPIQSPSQIMKVKKVKFSDEIVVIPSSKAMVDSAASPISTGNTAIASNHEEPIRRFGKAIGQFDEQIGYYTASKEEVMPYMSKKEMNGVVRLKVVISKKQLTELMSSRGSSDKQSSGLMEKMLAPLLSPSHKSDRSFHGVSSPSWRPSLDHIPEDHDFF